MPYIDQEFLDDAFGSAQVAALCPHPRELSATIELAEAETESALKMGGYDSAVPSSAFATVSLVPGVIKLAAYGAWLELAHGRQSLEIPRELQPYTRKIEEIRRGLLEIEGVSNVNTVRAVGGATFSESSSTITVQDGSRPPVLGRKNLDGVY